MITTFMITGKGRLCFWAGSDMHACVLLKTISTVDIRLYIRNIFTLNNIGLI